jgi:hypothetical protein
MLPRRTEQFGLDVIRVLGLVALLRPDLPTRLPRVELRRLAAQELLAVRSHARQPRSVQDVLAPR